MKKLIIVLILVSSIACSTTEYVIPHLALPPKTFIPDLKDREIECVSQETYSKLVQRDLATKFYIGRLETVIKSTWNTDELR